MQLMVGLSYLKRVKGLLPDTVPSGLKTKILKQGSLRGLNVDTAEQEKACCVELDQSY